MRRRLGIAMAVLALAAVLTLAFVGQNRWENRCRDASGTVEARFEGFITVIINGVPHLNPQYSYHCWIDGREVDV